MRAVIVTILLIAAFATSKVHADPLGDAQRLWEQKRFTEAFQAFAELARKGNPDAQLQLGEMYSFGEGTQQNDGEAQRWLAQAAAAGQKDAAESLELARQRVARKSEIAYYTDGFDGAGLRYGDFRCERPAIPDVSATRPEILEVDQRVRTYLECYGKFAAALNSRLPVQNTIPPALLKLMSQAEFDRASATVEQAYRRIGAPAQAEADTVAAEAKAWREATEQYVKRHN